MYFKQGLSWLLLDTAQVTHGRRTVASALEVGDEVVTHLIRGGDRARGQVQEPRASTILESHGEPVRLDFLIAVDRLDTQLVELQELRRVGGVVVARRKVWLELAWPAKAMQLQSEGAAACGCHRGPLRGRACLDVHAPSPQAARGLVVVAP